MSEPYRFRALSSQHGTHIHQLLQRQYPDAEIRVADEDYNAPTKQEFEAWLKSNPVSERQYHAEYYDCDDFARALRCAIFRIGHAMKTTLAVAYCEGYALQDLKQAGTYGKEGTENLDVDTMRICGDYMDSASEHLTSSNEYLNRASNRGATSLLFFFSL